MRKVGSRELKNRMGRYLREVKAGRSLAVTERGQHIATITPNTEMTAQENIGELLDGLEKQGLIRRGRGKLSRFRPVKSNGKPASRMIIEDRQ